MKVDELKMKLRNFLERMIDTYYGEPVIGEKLLNYTLKTIVKNNISKIDGILYLFADENGEIDAEGLIRDFVEQMGSETVTFDLKDYVDNAFIKGLLPDKALSITASDISNILNGY